MGFSSFGIALLAALSVAHVAGAVQVLCCVCLRIHWLDAEDDGSSKFLKVKCKKKIFRANANICSAKKFYIGKRAPCETCQKLWPDLLRNFFNN